MKYIVAILFFVFSSCVSAQKDHAIELVIIRSQHALLVKQGNMTLQKFKVALGSGGRKAKRREGDHSTPTGTYRISKIRESEHFHLFLQLNYPNTQDAKRALKNYTITRKQYRDILDAQTYGWLPPQNTALGGSIGIHGIGDETPDKIAIHRIADWTQGCIALRNKEVDKLSRYVKIGTIVKIVDKLPIKPRSP